MIKLCHKRGQISIELILLMLVVVIGAAVVATEMSKVKLSGGTNAANEVKYAASVAFANGHVSNNGTSGGTTNTTGNNNTNTNPTNTNNNKPDLVGALEVGNTVIHNNSCSCHHNTVIHNNSCSCHHNTVIHNNSCSCHHNTVIHNNSCSCHHNTVIHNNSCSCHHNTVIHNNSCSCHHNTVIHNNIYMVNIIVSNIGNENTNKSFVVTLKDNGNLIGEDTINGLNASESKIVSFNWYPGSIGEHHLVSYVDANDDIDESNESNNIDSKTVNAIGYNSTSITNVNISGGSRISPTSSGRNNELTITEINGTIYNLYNGDNNKGNKGNNGKKGLIDQNGGIVYLNETNSHSGKATSIIYRWIGSDSSLIIDGVDASALKEHKITIIASKDNPINYTITHKGNNNGMGHFYLSFNATHANITIEEGHSKTNIIDAIISTIENIINSISSSI
ncbi:CARDB domain-containing protein [Methanothermococcus okinawensis]|uniref:APHP domain protein n=1 Tax=Methanothermococcus okinawensis (strain DSM 14208 / JCM 11175 / IH1) TaxID=647113 RepID=F8AN20_METOI|nr:CARDB domain-containing protein [Methanothermococcus okinawensis]AEH06147.1 APHP domain protein [Methanothermococcus okinawensis IH1]